MRLIDIIVLRRPTPRSMRGNMRPVRDERTRRLADGRCRQRHWSARSSSEIQWEVVGIALVHHFHPETSTVQNVCPRINHMPIACLDGLVEVKTVEVECHGGDAERGKPDADDRERTKEKVERAAIIKASILEDQTSEVTMCGNDVVSLFLLTKLVSIILADLFGSLPNKGGRDEASVHSTKKDCRQIHRQHRAYEMGA